MNFIKIQEQKYCLVNLIWTARVSILFTILADGNKYLPLLIFKSKEGKTIEKN